eukprot:3728388-Rhodomonas_salina.1
MQRAGVRLGGRRGGERVATGGKGRAERSCTRASWRSCGGRFRCAPKSQTRKHASPPKYCCPSVLGSDLLRSDIKYNKPHTPIASCSEKELEMARRAFEQARQCSAE